MIGSIIATSNRLLFFQCKEDMVCFLLSEIAKLDEDNPNEGMGLPR
jgi:hypothetical protein